MADMPFLEHEPRTMVDSMVGVLSRCERLLAPVDPPQGEGPWQDQPSAHRLLHEGADLCLFGGGQLLEREGDRPQGTFVEVGRVVEA